MERNNLKKITGSRWFLPVVCAVSFVFGWWYLSITTCAPLGGDDEIINLQNYYYITHTPWWQVVLTHAKEILNQLALQSPASGRFPRRRSALSTAGFWAIWWCTGCTSWPGPMRTSP